MLRCGLRVHDLSRLKAGGCSCVRREQEDRIATLEHQLREARSKNAELLREINEIKGADQNAACAFDSNILYAPKDCQYMPACAHALKGVGTITRNGDDVFRHCLVLGRDHYCHHMPLL